MLRKINDINQGDVLVFKADDNRYKSIICTSTYKKKSPQNFTFLATTIDTKHKPLFNEIITANFFGIGNIKANFFKYLDNEIEKMWEFHPEIAPYHLGSYGLIIWRKDFMKFRDNFEVVGSISIVDNLDKNGNGSVNASDWRFIKDFFNSKIKDVLYERGQKTFSIESIVKCI